MSRDAPDGAAAPAIFYRFTPTCPCRQALLALAARPENIWETANFADNKRVLFELIYNGTSTGSNCKLTTDVPTARSLAERRRILSEDPVG